MTKHEANAIEWKTRRAEYLVRAGRTAELRAEGLVDFVGEPAPPADAIEPYTRRRRARRPYKARAVEA